MTRIARLLSAGAFALALATSPALAHPPIPDRAPADEQAAFDADRADILTMAGDFKVRFDMQESTPWREGYTPIEAKVSGGHESVRVIEDTGRKIVLQHMLVVEMDGQSHVIKHWRQDWEYEPARYLAYSDTSEWSWLPLDERQRKGRWSQTVYQVDDSPRYSSYGEFETQGGIRRWRSNWTWRPLARRDAIRHPVYDRYYGINRHQPTPDGWIHWQDNMKMGHVDGALRPVVQEYVLNTYTRFSDYDTRAADAYWDATKGYWAAIRAEWDAVAAAKGGIAIEEEAQTGTVISGRLLEIADEIKDGTTREAEGIAEARKLIDDNTATVLAGG
ncbi:MAG TPA: DUF6607 family protein [Croceibacterium sp.]